MLTFAHRFNRKKSLTVITKFQAKYKMMWAFIVLMAIVSLLVSGCKTTGHRYVDIKPPIFGAQFIPQQLNTLLNDTGFHRIQFSIGVTEQGSKAEELMDMRTGMVIEDANRLLMRYQHQTYPELLINVSIGKFKGDVKLDFYEAEQKELSGESIKIYNQFREHLLSTIYDENDVTEK